MRNYIFPIIKKQREDKQKRDNRIPLYKRDYFDIPSPPKDDSININREYTEIDFNIDEIKV
jgi:hypothetical protein